MSEEKFTPGPWFVDHGVPGKPRIFSRADNLIKSMVCACEHGALSRQEHDAALIAAAPKMYEKLKMMRQKFAVSQDDELIMLGLEIEELLKKARGEE